jgi:mono/diheme cytochrome c family protein
MKSAVLAAVALSVLVAMPVMARKKPESKHYVQLTHVPDEARAQANPLEHDTAAPVAGRKLYDRHCADCHGATAEGGRKGPSLFVPEIQDASDGALFWVITNGNVRAGMPVWSKLPEPQRWQITSYLKSLGIDAGASAPRAPDPAPGR